MENQEIRNYEVSELRACGNKDEKKSIEGRAIPFNIPSPNREGFVEIIMPEAIDGVLEKSDIFMLYNHNKQDGFMARSKRGKGSLKIDVKDDGVYFNFDCADDKLSRGVYEKVCRGDLDETSWAFTVAEDKWEKQSDGTYVRTIMKFDQIYDFSIVDQSYYGIDNACGCKRFAEVQEADRIALEEAKKAEEQRAAEDEAQKEKERQEKIEEIYKQLREEYKKYL